MKMKLKWQRGEADIVSVAVGLVILSIIVAGTSSAMIYGRDVLIRQENEKAVAYLLRGFVDEWQSRIQMEEDERSATNMGRTVNERTSVLTTAVAGGNTPPLVVDLIREPVRAVDVLETGQDIDWYTLKCHARWSEHDMPGGEDDRFQARELTFVTYIVIRS
ncbi:hypothetical protein HZB60_07540 [candidate division KSB1 bacterium]|nr:hypothetical protein [candidate division KSB1 bacterium]